MTAQRQPMQPKLSVCVPFYNEEGAARNVIDTLHASLRLLNEPFEIVAIQNGSRDATPELLAQAALAYGEVRVVDIPVNKGFGYGIQAGLNAARGEIIGYMPGDGQIDPESVPKLYSAMRREGTAIGQGRRITRGDGFLRLIVSKTYNAIGSLLFLRPMGDLNGHPKLFTSALHRRMALRSDDHFIDAEIMLKAAVLREHVTAVDVLFLKRETGKSAVRITTCLEFLQNLLSARFDRSDKWGLNKLSGANSAES